MWVRGELTEHLRVLDDGTRVEVVGGEIVVSPGPTLGHNAIVQEIVDAVVMTRMADPSVPWRCLQTTDLNLVTIKDGYIPDLIVLDVEVLNEARKAEARHLLPHRIELDAEVTSPSTARVDRKPPEGRRRPSKFAGYAHVGIPHYLLVERDPRHPHIALLTEPDQETGFYQARQTWTFGEVVQVPGPFGFEIDTSEWQPWAE
jgi:hypothetical protein